MDRRVRTDNPLFKAGDTSSPITLTALRVGVGIIMMAHGWLKVTDVAGWKQLLQQLDIAAPEVTAWLAIAGELLGGAGLLLGLLTPLAGLGVLAVMLTAIVTVHLPHGLLASNNGFEYPLTLALVAAFFIARGAGPFSLDALISSRGRGHRTSEVPPPAPPIPGAMT